MPLTMLHPVLFALGLACVAIPIALHLLKRKRRPIPWGAMRFLEQAFRKRRRVLTIEQLILLALRCAVLVLIALGVGSLMLGSGIGGSTPTTLVIVLDDSIGASAARDGATGLDRNKLLALAALDEMDPARGDRAMLVRGAARARGIVLPASSDLGAVRALIEDTPGADSALDLAGAMALIGGADQDPDSRRVLLLASRPPELGAAIGAMGDPVSAGFDRVIAAAPPRDGPGSIGSMDNMDNMDNIGIVSAEPTRWLVTQAKPALPLGVRVRLVRSGAAGGGAERTSTISVLDDSGNLVGSRSVRWGAGQGTLSAVAAVDPGAIGALSARTALLTIRIDADANPRDDVFRLALPTRSAIRVGVIDLPVGGGADRGSEINPSIQASRWVRAALAPGESFGITIADIDATRAAAMLAPDLDAVVLLAPSSIAPGAWDRIGQLASQGTLVIVTPDSASGSLGWIERIGAMAPGLDLSGSVLAETEDRPLALAGDQSLGASALLMGIAPEFDALAPAVRVDRRVRFPPAAQNNALLTLGDGSPLVLASSPEDDRGVVVVFACAFDVGWTNLPARPLFVPLLQEIVRQGVGLGAAPAGVIAGARIPAPAWVSTNQRVEIEHGSLVAPKGGAASAGGALDSSRAGVIAQLDAQGATRGIVTVNPDAAGAAGGAIGQQRLGALLTARLDVDSIDWIDLDALPSGGGKAPASLLGSSAPGVPVALWMLAAALVIAGIETVLARVFTSRLVASDARGAGA